MVLRERKINQNSDEVQVHCSFSLVDVCGFLKMYAEPFAEIREIPHTEQDICHWLEYSGRAFLSWPQKWRPELSKWCFAVALRNNLLIQSATGKNYYYLADCLFAKRGRPKKND